jgi:hypothetical protein
VEELLFLFGFQVVIYGLEGKNIEVQPYANFVIPILLELTELMAGSILLNP